MSSDRHHYLPKFYIKEFTNKNNQLFVYDKIKDKVENRLYTPKQIFFKWGDNTIDFGEGPDSSLEKNYATFENIIAPEYKKFINKTNKFDTLYLRSILLLASIIFHRIPANTTALNSYYNLTFKDNIYKNIPGSNKFFNLFKAINDFQERSNKYSGIEKIYYNDANIDDICILGDNPIVFKEPLITSNIFNSDFIMPISKNIKLMYDKNFNKSEFSGEKIIIFDILQILQSDHYVASSNKQYLEVLVKLSKKFRNSDIDNLKYDLFNL